MTKNKNIKNDNINNIGSNDPEEICFKDEPDIQGKEISSFSFNEDSSN